MQIQRFLLIPVLVTVAGLACSDDGPTAPPVPGSVSGLVTSTIGEDFPLQHVAVTVDDKIFWTGLDGRYLIEGVTPGSHVLIASRWDHQVHEATVDIMAGQLTIHDVLLTFPD